MSFLTPVCLLDESVHPLPESVHFTVTVTPDVFPVFDLETVHFGSISSIQFTFNVTDSFLDAMFGHILFKA